MEESRKRPQRTIQVISLSQSFASKPETKLPTDLPASLAHLREILLKKAERNDGIDSEVSQSIESIKNQIHELINLTEHTELFDRLQAIVKTYIDDLLPITKALKILSHDSFQKIFTTLISIEQTFDVSSLFENDPMYGRTVFNRSFDLLSLPVMKDFLNEKYPIELFPHVASILRVITHRIGSTVEYIVFKKNELQNQVPIIRSLLEYVDRNKQNFDLTDMPVTINSILTLIWLLVNDTILVPNMIETNCSEYVLRWTSMSNISLDIQFKCIHIIHNLARHEKGMKVLNDADCINILKDFKRRILDPNRTNQDDIYAELRLLYCMAVSLLTEPKENKEDLDSLRRILDQLMQLAIDAGQATSNKCRGFHVSEPVVVLTKLCVHDEILKYVLNESNIQRMEADTKVEFFCQLLIKFRGALAAEDDLDQLTLIALFNILWSISFHDEYFDELKSDSKFLMSVKSLAIDDGSATVDQYVPNHMSSIPKAANGILWNLDENNPARAVRTTPIPATNAPPSVDNNSEDRTRVMVSYSHTDNDFCRQLVDALQKDKRLGIWVDFAYCHTEDLWEEIGEAIERAHVILFLMSKEYQDSKSCRQEVMYAKDSLKKRFIPIYVKKDFQATGWLGVRIVGPQYIRFGKRPFDDTIKELVKLIFEDKTQSESVQKPETNPPVVIESKPVENTTTNLTTPSEIHPAQSNEDNHIESNVKPSKKPVEQWTKKDIAQWFTDNQIHEPLVNLYDFKHGTDLLLYGQCLRPEWQIEYNDIKDRYQQKYNTPLYRDQFVRFVGAVNRLPSLQSKSKTCVLS